jgi:hypothetical protein
VASDTLTALDTDVAFIISLIVRLTHSPTVWLEELFWNFRVLVHYAFLILFKFFTWHLKYGDCGGVLRYGRSTPTDFESI